jgi:D-glycero-D-manno-heptose 1,7-bisphosphate phosphatase
MRPAVFFDRDGVLNVDRHYLYRREDWEWVPGAREALQLAHDAGFLCVVVTNQSGIARGYYSEEDLAELHSWVAQQAGGLIDAFYHCPHGPESDCECRKPRPGMLLRAAQELDIDLSRSVLIGDKASDIEAATAAGCPGFLYEGQDLLSLVCRAIRAVTA